MTNEAIILDTLKFIREHTTRMHIQFVNIRQTIWWNFSIYTQDALEARMLSETLMSFNPKNQNEVELTGQARPYIEKGNKQLEIEFLQSIQTQPDIEFFMVNHFIKPNPKAELTKNETDNGVNFLKELKGKGFIRYNKPSDITHIINWYTDTAKTTKRWFDTVDEDNPILIYAEELGKQYLLLHDKEISKIPLIEAVSSPVPHVIYNIHLENPMGTAIGDHASQSFKAHDISNANNNSTNPKRMSVIMKWILGTISAIIAGLIVWWITKS